MNEEAVEVVHTFNPSSQSVEDYSYPRPGKHNAKSELKLLVLKFSEGQQASLGYNHVISFVTKLVHTS